MTDTTEDAINLRRFDNGRAVFSTVTSGPAFDALHDAPLHTQWTGWSATYEKMA